MLGKKRSWLKVAAIVIFSLIGWVGSHTLAQELPPRLFITGSDVGSLPSIELHVYGMDGQGNALDLSQQTFTIQHDDSPAGPIEYYGRYQAGTFTLFLIDIPTGVSDQFPAIQEAIIQYASSPTMMEQVDYVAIYQVGGTAAAELLPPDTFYNGVRNLFATPPTPETGATALVDSMMGLLEQMESLKPNPDMAASMVVITDGTDVVSRFDPEDVAEQAAELGVPLHTIWLDNLDLSAASQEFGQSYLADIAAASGGLAAKMENKAEHLPIWNRIASFRDQHRIRYTLSSLSGGTFPVLLSIADTPQVTAETTVTIAGNTPTIVINLPPESRTLSLPNLGKPVKLRFSTTVSWLDGVERQITAAQLVVNQTEPKTVPIDNITQFDIEVDNLQYGDNAIQIAVLDEQGLRATSPLMLLTINEGGKNLPDDLKPANLFGRILLILVLLVVIVGVGFVVWRQGWLAWLAALLPRGRSKRPRPTVTLSPDVSRTAGHLPVAPEQSYQRVLAHIDVLESVSRMPAQIALTGVHVKIGRSPAQTDVAFENDITVSRVHASLMLEGSHYRIFDEGSTSGVWVNEQQVPEYGIQLMHGDEIHLGAVHLRFRQP